MVLLGDKSSVYVAPGSHSIASYVCVNISLLYYIAYIGMQDCTWWPQVQGQGTRGGGLEESVFFLLLPVYFKYRGGCMMEWPW